MGKHDPSLAPLIELCQKKYKGFIENNVFKDINIELIESVMMV